MPAPTLLDEFFFFRLTEWHWSASDDGVRAKVSAMKRERELRFARRLDDLDRLRLGIVDEHPIAAVDAAIQLMERSSQ
jgi:hypothetical protein